MLRSRWDCTLPVKKNKKHKFYVRRTKKAAVRCCKARNHFGSRAILAQASSLKPRFASEPLPVSRRDVDRGAMAWPRGLTRRSNAVGIRPRPGHSATSGRGREPVGYPRTSYRVALPGGSGPVAGVRAAAGDAPARARQPPTARCRHSGGPPATRTLGGPGSTTTDPARCLACAASARGGRGEGRSRSRRVPPHHGGGRSEGLSRSRAPGRSRAAAC